MIKKLMQYFCPKNETLASDEAQSQDYNQNKDSEQIGASLFEYVLLVALIAIIGITAMQTLTQGVSKQFSSVASTLG